CTASPNRSRRYPAHPPLGPIRIGEIVPAGPPRWPRREHKPDGLPFSPPNGCLQMSKAQSLFYFLLFSFIDRRTDPFWIQSKSALPDGLMRQVSTARGGKKARPCAFQKRGFGLSARFTPGVSCEKLVISRSSRVKSAKESKAAGDAHDVKISRSCGHRRCDLREPRSRPPFLRDVRCRH